MRTMPMMEAVAHYLKMILDQQKEAREFLGNTYVESDYLIVDEFGKPLSLNRLNKLFNKAIKEKGMRPIRFHDLRHPRVKLGRNITDFLN